MNSTVAQPATSIDELKFLIGNLPKEGAISAQDAADITQMVKRAGDSVSAYVAISIALAKAVSSSRAHDRGFREGVDFDGDSVQ